MIPYVPYNRPRIEDLVRSDTFQTCPHDRLSDCPVNWIKFIAGLEWHHYKAEFSIYFNRLAKKNVELGLFPSLNCPAQRLTQSCRDRIHRSKGSNIRLHSGKRVNGIFEIIQQTRDRHIIGEPSSQ